MSAAQAWTPYNSLTIPPTNLKEAIDWVLRVTGRDGKENKAAPAKPPQFSCLCYLAKAVKDLLYDAKDPGSPGPSPKRNWDDMLLTEESTIVKPVLEDLGLLSDGSSTSAASTCAGGTEVIKALIDQLAQGLQKWVGWQEKGDECCLKGTDGIGRKCTCSTSGVAGCCTGAPGTPCHDCTTCGPSGKNKCYQSAYQRPNGQPSPPGPPTECYWPTISDKPDQVHLLARIFLGSVCLIWSGLSQLGFLTGKDGERWSQKGNLHEVDKGLGSFMAAMGYDLERLNGSPPGKNGGEFVHELLTGKDKDKGVPWKEFTTGASKDSVAEYYSSIYDNAQKALNNKKTEEICTKYPLLVLHILASGYFRAGSAGAKNIIAAKPSQPAPTTPKTTPDSTKKEDTPSSRKPRTIREILYWLSALPYSEKYRDLVERMQQKAEQVTQGNGEKDKDKIELHSEGVNKTDLYKDKITHYLMAACGYCPLVLIGIQGTIEKEVKADTQAPSAGPAAAAGAKDNKCKKKYNEKKPSDECSKCPSEGKVCYRGYHLAVKQFGPLHGMYANGLFGFDMEGSPAQCLDQLRIYVYHCFYQLYFLRKQCSTGVEVGGAGAKTVLGWKSCRYGSGVNPSGGVSNQNPWRCEAQGVGGAGNDKCKCKESASHRSPLMYFLCDGLGLMACKSTVGKGVDDYPPIETHWTTKDDNPKGHFGTPDLNYPKLCPVPMGWSSESGSGSTQQRENHFKDLSKTHKQESLSPPASGTQKYPAHCTGNTLSHLLEYYCDPDKCPSGTLVVLLRLLACITPTVPRTLGDLFGFYYYIVYIGGNQGGSSEVTKKLSGIEKDVRLKMIGSGVSDTVVTALNGWKGSSSTSGSACSHSTKDGSLKTLFGCSNGTNNCCQYLSPLSGQQYGQLSPLMAGTYLSWLVYLIEEFKTGLEGLESAFKNIQCKEDCTKGAAAGGGCGGGQCQAGTHGNRDTCCCASVVSCTGVLPVLYKYGFGYGNVTELHNGKGSKKCDAFLSTLKGVLEGKHLKNGSNIGLHHEINQLIYTTRLPWIFVLTVAWLVAVLYLAVGAIWPLDWTHMRSHCRGWFRKGSLSPWEVLMVGKKKGRGILEFFGKT
ncbi:variant erythrocyte surface antigen-1 beta subunit [Babesia bovis T2Bo]|uniref:variant erythrocyte surface antigen-1 beta subunit n=1 Tax=Babesia bovis T2Bo TaxID=484906 RepID=UPI001C366A41|nr:variant erythrocyte surface antigen-1 beta subunit [Babesia bovis T2Bo]KAG6440187.1 variant erythrocyte surface antigen-1 beta subunit [Babesia bovis T2Bo]